MRRAVVKVNKVPAGMLTEADGKTFLFEYFPAYEGASISLTMPVRAAPYRFEDFPPFFDGLLPEGVQLEGLLRSEKIDRKDYFSQLVAVGRDLVGAVTIEEEDGDA